MPHISMKESNPSRYAQVRAEQEILQKEFTYPLMARICPYCGHKVELLSRGNHGASSIKCPNCGEYVTFPPVFFRMTK